MKMIIKEDIKRFFTFKILLLILGCFLFSIGERQGTKLSYQGYILNMITEQYYLTYFMMPIFLFFIFKNLDEDMKYILIRFKTYWRYFISKVLAIIINVIGFLAIQLSIFLLLGIGLPFNNSFELNKYVLQDMTLFEEFNKYFNFPSIAIVVSEVYMVLGLIVIAIVFFCLNHFFSKKHSSKIIIFLYLLMVVGLKVPGINSIPFLFMNNFFIFHHNFIYRGKLLISISSMFVLIISSFVLIKRYWNKPINSSKVFSRVRRLDYYRIKLFSKKNLIIIIGLVTMISLWKILQITLYEDIDLKKYFISIFYGYNINQINLFKFLEMLILNGTPLYLLSIFLEREGKDRGLPMAIRFNKKIKYVDKLLKNAIIFIGVYVLVIIVVGFLLFILKGLRVEDFIESFRFISIATISRFFDITLQFLLMFSLYTFLANMTIAFLFTISLNLVLFLPWTWVVYFPIGISDISRSSLLLGRYGISFGLSILILMICNVILLVYIRKIGYKRLFN